MEIQQKGGSWGKEVVRMEVDETVEDRTRWWADPSSSTTGEFIHSLNTIY
jgi:hypothetical protein